MPNKGALIYFEGVDGCGKSTQLQLVAEALGHAGVPVTTTREPGGCPVAERIRTLVLSGGADDLCHTSELLLFLAARVEHHRQVIEPAIARGEVVLCDRGPLSSLVYQGVVRGLGADLVRSLHADLGLPWPDGNALVLQVSLNESQRRRAGRSGKPLDRFDAESESFVGKVAAAFDHLVKTGEATGIDGSGDERDVTARCVAVIQQITRGEGCRHAA